MPRTREFVTDDAVVAARSVFWEHGYDQASVPALERATGLGRSSIYQAFGSKRGLFDACVENYLDEILRPRLRPLQQEPVAPQALVDYLEGLRAALADAGSAPGQHGCLLLNAASGPIGRQQAVAERVTAYREELRTAMRRGLAAARAAEAPAADARPAEAGAAGSGANGEPDDDVLERDAEACASLVTSAFMLTRVDNSAALRCVDAARAMI
ncbi:TetR/AcrR family transcriptional regulator [Nesterenkonia lacusekhoensis]|uniref:AcrR family transcriptional regulator n=1 Tax=Nesterenkonia lacusekhoensis TaxID=150832 RepID=A0ABS4T3U0_9MICC|nr:TetR/AcrR family transcriptional regulator [Nesterenkonia lacusekhoensis]MBP2318785.1 AcrR family transcriptional regulator [Nesterenkonia lacusekhoensis]